MNRAYLCWGLTILLFGCLFTAASERVIAQQAAGSDKPGAAGPSAAAPADAAAPAAAPAAPAAAPAAAPGTTPGTAPAAAGAAASGDPAQAVAAAAADVGLPLATKREPMVYHTFGRRDPFKSLVEKGVTFDQNRPPGIEGMSIAELSLKGILNLPGGRVAVFEGSDNKAYQRKEGEPVFDGKIVKVGENQVIFEKIILDPFGREKEKKLIEVKLHM